MAYERGQEVFRSQPFAYVIDTFYLQEVCDFCIKYKKEENENFSLKRCTACKVVYYCSSKCQKKAWKSHHKYECNYFNNIPIAINSSSRYCTHSVKILTKMISRKFLSIILGHPLIQIVRE